MNIEEEGLLFYLTTEAVYVEYGEDLFEATQLASGKWFKHASRCRNISAFGRMDNRIITFKPEALVTYMEFVDPQMGSEL